MKKQQRETCYSRCPGVLGSLSLFVPLAVLCWGGSGGVAGIETRLWLIVQYVQLYKPGLDSVCWPTGRLWFQALRATVITFHLDSFSPQLHILQLLKGHPRGEWEGGIERHLSALQIWKFGT